MLIVAGTVQIQVSERTALIEAATDMMQASRNEPGCLAYDITASLTDPSQFHIYEQWQDQAALDQHFKMPHMLTFQDAIAGKVSEMKIKTYEVMKEPAEP